MASVSVIGERAHYVGIEIDGEPDFFAHVRA
jgi:hypothetical protein